jgi:hypothetical protein
MDMSYFKNICLIVLLALAFNGCSELYNPNISSDTKALIVEGVITNEAGPYTIKLSIAEIFSADSVIGSKTVSKAKLSITDNQNQTFKLTESKAGSYVTPINFTAKVGNSYKLLITTNDGNSYESNVETLLPPQTYDSIHVIRAAESYLNNKNQMQNVDGANILIDLFKSVSKSDVVPACRFANKITVQYDFTDLDYDANGKLKEHMHWHYFGWRTFNLNGIENITKEMTATSNPFIQNHLIGFMPFPASNYGFLIPTSVPLIYYLRVNQYTINNDSYLFYKGANNQLSASGKIFDPITTQLHGNLRCVSNSSKIVLGLFEVSSVKQHAFVVKGSSSSENISIKKVPVVDIPADKAIADEVSELNGSNPIPYPIWWDHN